MRFLECGATDSNLDKHQRERRDRLRADPQNSSAE